MYYITIIMVVYDYVNERKKGVPFKESFSRCKRKSLSKMCDLSAPVVKETHSFAFSKLVFFSVIVEIRRLFRRSKIVWLGFKYIVIIIIVTSMWSREQ